MRQQTCKQCGSVFHSAMYHKPRKPIAKSPLKPRIRPIKASSAKKTRGKAINRSNLIKQLDKIYSAYIRLKDCKQGYTQCVTCGDIRWWSEHQNGHFFSRGRLPTRWDDDNCHVQCMRCNIFLKGNYIKYTTWMIDTYGREFVDKLEAKSNSKTPITTLQIKELILHYTEVIGHISI